MAKLLLARFLGRILWHSGFLRGLLCCWIAFDEGQVDVGDGRFCVCVLVDFWGLRLLGTLGGGEVWLLMWMVKGVVT